jgi:hypothetical protein
MQKPSIESTLFRSCPRQLRRRLGRRRRLQRRRRQQQVVYRLQGRWRRLLLGRYLTDLANGRPLANIALEFSLSNEFQQRYGSVDNGAFVDLLYLNILNRVPDQAGRAFWVKQLTTKTQDRGQVLLEFSEGVENVSYKTRLVAVFRMFLTMRRTGPASAEFADLVNPILFYKAPDVSSAAYAIRHSAGYSVRFG